MTLSTMPLSIKGLYVTLSIDDTQHAYALPLCSVSHFMYYYAECHYADFHYADCRDATYNSIAVIYSCNFLYYWQLVS